MKKIFLFIVMAFSFFMIFLISEYFLENYKEKNIPEKSFKEQISEDFEYIFNIIKTQHPLIEALKKEKNYDFLADYEKHKKHILQAKNKTEFFFLLNDVLAKLENEHTHMMTKADVRYAIGIYSQSNHNDFKWGIYKKLTRDKKLQKNYEIEIGMTKEQEEQARKDEIAKIDAQKEKTKNVDFFDILDKKLAYISIKELTHISLLDSDETIEIKKYLQKIKKYKGLIIDIRWNSGWDSRYWTNFLLPAIINKNFSLDLYSFFKKWEPMDSYKKTRPNMTEINYKEINKIFPNSKNLENILDKFAYQEIQSLEVKPDKESINFEGKIYLLVDEWVYSSAEMLAIFAKYTWFATLIWTNTKWDGIWTDPMIVVLPNTHFAVRYAKQLWIAPNWSINTISGTKPDILIKDTIKSLPKNKKEALNNEAIKYIINDLENKKK